MQDRRAKLDYVTASIDCNCFVRIGFNSSNHDCAPESNNRKTSAMNIALLIIRFFGKVLQTVISFDQIVHVFVIVGPKPRYSSGLRV